MLLLRGNFVPNSPILDCFYPILSYHSVGDTGAVNSPRFHISCNPIWNALAIISFIFLYSSVMEYRVSAVRPSFFKIFCTQSITIPKPVIYLGSSFTSSSKCCHHPSFLVKFKNYISLIVDSIYATSSGVSSYLMYNSMSVHGFVKSWIGTHVKLSRLMC